VLAAVVLALVLAPLPGFLRRGWLGAACDLGHAPFGFLLAYFACRRWKCRNLADFARVAGIAGVGLAVLEVIQPLAGRTASLWDWGFGMSGVCLALLAVRAGGRRTSWGNCFAALAGLAAFSLPLGPLAGNLLGRRNVRNLFPELADFSSARWLRTWRVERDGEELLPDLREAGAAGSKALVFKIEPGRHLALHLDGFGPDWSDVTALEWEGSFTADAPLVLGVRLDTKSGRLQYEITPEAGGGRWEMPLREADRVALREVRHAVLFAPAGQVSATLLLHRVAVKRPGKAPPR
jgi:hypothetical protein